MTVERRHRFDEMYRAHHRAVLGYFLRRLDDPEEAHDAAADVFLVLWRRLERVPDGDEGIAWMFGVCARVLSTRRRTLRRQFRLWGRVSSLPHDPSDLTSAAAVANSEHADVRRALDRLKHEDRELLKLATWDELPHAVIAERFGCTPHAVDQRIYRALGRLSRQLEASGYESAARARGGSNG